MYPHERSLVKRYANKPFVLLGVNSDNDREAIKKVVKDEKITWRSWWNGGGPGGPIARAWGVNGWPTFFVIDTKGIIRHRLVGSQGLKEALTKVMHDAEQDTPKLAPKSVPDGDRQEHLAETKLGFAKTLLESGKTDRGRQRLQEIIQKYPKTSAAKEAQQILDKPRNE
jgi:hypothetical protein